MSESITPRNCSRVTVGAGLISGALVGSVFQSWYTLAAGLLVGVALGLFVAACDVGGER